MSDLNEKRKRLATLQAEVRALEGEERDAVDAARREQEKEKQRQHLISIHEYFADMGKALAAVDPTGAINISYSRHDVTDVLIPNITFMIGEKVYEIKIIRKRIPHGIQVYKYVLCGAFSDVHEHQYQNPNVLVAKVIGWQEEHDRVATAEELALKQLKYRYPNTVVTVEGVKTILVTNETGTASFAFDITEDGDLDIRCLSVVPHPNRIDAVCDFMLK